jgi:hypothetical protein
MLQMDKEQKCDIDQFVKFVLGGRTVENRGLDSCQGTLC